MWRCYEVPGDAVSLECNDGRIAVLADRLYEAGAERPDGISVTVEVLDGETRARSVAAFEALERNLVWERTGTGYRVRLGKTSVLAGELTREPARVTMCVAECLLDAAPSLVARYALEAPVAYLLSRRGFHVVHAGAVTRDGRAVVVRGASDAGKSTLVAAAFASGLSVLSDESLLARRDDPDELLAAVRDLALSEDAARLAGVLDRTRRAFTGGEEKRRVDLFSASAPRDREARRVATVLLGPREPGPARLEPLAPASFGRLFDEGAIPQESDLDHTARAWAAPAFRLTGARDLDGAVSLLRDLLAGP